MIGDWVFENCISLESIDIPANVTSINISAFEKCSGLRNITIPANVTKIKYNAFADCNNLTSIEILGDITAIEKSTFNECTKLRAIYVPAKKTDYYNVRLKVQLWKYIVELAPVKKAKKK